jgi:hypothetical protein
MDSVTTIQKYQTNSENRSQGNTGQLSASTLITTSNILLALLSKDILYTDENYIALALLKRLRGVAFILGTLSFEHSVKIPNPSAAGPAPSRLLNPSPIVVVSPPYCALLQQDSRTWAPHLELPSSIVIVLGTVNRAASPLSDGRACTVEKMRIQKPSRNFRMSSGRIKVMRRGND